MKQSKQRKKNYTLNGITMCIADWAKTIGISKQALSAKLNRGVPFIDAVTIKPKIAQTAKPSKFIVVPAKNESVTVVLQCLMCGHVWQALPHPIEKTCAEIREAVSEHSNCKNCKSKDIILNWPDY